MMRARQGRGGEVRLHARARRSRSSPRSSSTRCSTARTSSVTVTYKSRFGTQPHVSTRTFEGIMNLLERRYQETSSDMVKEEIEQYMSDVPCRVVRRQAAEAREPGGHDQRAEHLRGRDDVGQGGVRVVRDAARSRGARQIIGEQVIKEISARLGFLLDVGLDYLTLDRTAATLAGGEAQRIRLATQIGCGLMGVLYILDEPSIGLHQRDNQRLIDTLHQAARPRQHDHRGRARRGDHARAPTTSSTSAPARASTAARSSPRARSTTS